MNKEQEVIKLLEGLETALILEYGEAVVDCQYTDLRDAIALLKQPSHHRLGSMSMYPKPAESPPTSKEKTTPIIEPETGVKKGEVASQPSEISMAVAVDDCDITDKPSVPEGYLLVKAKSFMGKLEKCSSCDTDKTDCKTCWQDECYQEPVEKPPVISMAVAADDCDITDKPPTNEPTKLIETRIFESRNWVRASDWNILRDRLVKAEAEINSLKQSRERKDEYWIKREEQLVLRIESLEALVDEYLRKE